MAEIALYFVTSLARKRRYPIGQYRQEDRQWKIVRNGASFCVALFSLFTTISCGCLCTFFYSAQDKDWPSKERLPGWFSWLTVLGTANPCPKHCITMFTFPARRQLFYVRFRSDGYEVAMGAISEASDTGTDTGFMLEYTLSNDNCWVINFCKLCLD